MGGGVSYDENWCFVNDRRPVWVGCVGCDKTVQKSRSPDFRDAKRSLNLSQVESYCNMKYSSI